MFSYQLSTFIFALDLNWFQTFQEESINCGIFVSNKRARQKHGQTPAHPPHLPAELWNCCFFLETWQSFQSFTNIRQTLGPWFGKPVGKPTSNQKYFKYLQMRKIGFEESKVSQCGGLWSAKWPRLSSLAICVQWWLFVPGSRQLNATTWTFKGTHSLKHSVTILWLKAHFCFKTNSGKMWSIIYPEIAETRLAAHFEICFAAWISVTSGCYFSAVSGRWNSCSRASARASHCAMTWNRRANKKSGGQESMEQRDMAWHSTYGNICYVQCYIMPSWGSTQTTPWSGGWYGVCSEYMRLYVHGICVFRLI